MQALVLKTECLCLAAGTVQNWSSLEFLKGNQQQVIFHIPVHIQLNRSEMLATMLAFSFLTVDVSQGSLARLICVFVVL